MILTFLLSIFKLNFQNSISNFRILCWCFVADFVTQFPGDVFVQKFFETLEFFNCVHCEITNNAQNAIEKKFNDQNNTWVEYEYTTIPFVYQCFHFIIKIVPIKFSFLPNIPGNKNFLFSFISNSALKTRY